MRIPTRCLLAAIFFVVAVVPITATASTPFWTVDVNLASYHLERTARQTLNQENFGLGVTARINNDWSVSAGWYRNSFRRGSTYLLANWTPLHAALLGGWSLAVGGTAGVDGGYRSSEIATQPLVAAALLRVIAPAGWSINFTAVPNGPHCTGFVGAQMSLPL